MLFSERHKTQSGRGMHAPGDIRVIGVYRRAHGNEKKIRVEDLKKLVWVWCNSSVRSGFTSLHSEIDESGPLHVRVHACFDVLK